jgi:uncharacterized HAD superfamily protein
MRIAIDIDSTLHHYWDQFSALAEERFGVILPYESQRTWRVDRLKSDQVQWLVEQTHGRDLITAAEPYEGAVDVVNRWHEAGHYIHITSHRSPNAYAATADWLAAIGMAHDDLYLSMDKIGRCRQIGIDLLIDDSPVNLAGAHDAGIAAATLRHPWNESVIATHGVIAADDWPELERLLEPLLSRG